MHKILIFSFFISFACTTVNAQKTAADHFRYGYEMYLKNEPQKALEHFNTSIEMDAEPPNVFFIRATTKMLLKDYDGAVADYQAALDKGYANKHLGYKYMGEACLLNGKKEEAEKYLKEAEKHKPSIPEE